MGTHRSIEQAELPPSKRMRLSSAPADTTIAFLFVTDYSSNPRVRNCTGMVAQFKLPPKSNGIILQYVEHTTTRSDATETVFFTEGWEVRERYGAFPDKGKDYFLVPDDFRESDGEVRIKAHAWFVPSAGRETPKQMLADHGLSKGGTVIAGTLASKEGCVDTLPAEHVAREWSASWKASPPSKGWSPKIEHMTEYVLG
jgi:hypothetical protein